MKEYMGGQFIGDFQEKWGQYFMEECIQKEVSKMARAIFGSKEQFEGAKKKAKSTLSLRKRRNGSVVVSKARVQNKKK